MVQELIPREEKQSSFFVNFLLFLSILILVASIAGYFWIRSQVGETKEEVIAIETETLNIRNNRDKATEDQVFRYAKKIDDFSVLLAKRKEVYPLFNFLESLIHKRVTLAELSLTKETGEINLEGETENFKILAEQMLILENNNSVLEPKIINLSLGEEGGIEFEINFSLDPGTVNNE